MSREELDELWNEWSSRTQVNYTNEEENSKGSVVGFGRIWILSFSRERSDWNRRMFPHSRLSPTTCFEVKKMRKNKTETLKGEFGNRTSVEFCHLSALHWSKLIPFLIRPYCSSVISFGILNSFSRLSNFWLHRGIEIQLLVCARRINLTWLHS